MLGGVNDQTAAATELGRYLRAQRGQLTPGEAGLPTYSGLRRTPGLRREELASLAGISNDYYTRLERGKETRPSPQVIDALARALRLDADEHDHLRKLAAQAARRAAEPPAPPSRTVPPGMKVLLESLRPCPAHVVARNGDLLAWNPGGLRLLAGIADWPATQRNVCALHLPPPRRPDRVRGLAGPAPRLRPSLRAQSGLEPDAPDLAAIVGELVLKSPEFAKLWDRYDVAGHSRPHQDVPPPRGRRPHPRLSVDAAP